jgi:hypothetical protein
MKKQTQAATQETLLSHDPAKAMQEMMQAIDALRNIYVEETIALKAADTKAFFGVQDRKIEAAQNYHAGITEAMARKDELLQAHPQMKSLFRRKQEEFSKIADENLEALDRMRRTVDRLGNRIMRSARDSAMRDGVSYSARGDLSGYKNKPVTMGLNESA